MTVETLIDIMIKTRRFVNLIRFDPINTRVVLRISEVSVPNPFSARYFVIQIFSYCLKNVSMSYVTIPGTIFILRNAFHITIDRNYFCSKDFFHVSSLLSFQIDQQWILFVVLVLITLFVRNKQKDKTRFKKILSPLYQYIQIAILSLFEKFDPLSDFFAHSKAFSFTEFSLIE